MRGRLQSTAQLLLSLSKPSVFTLQMIGQNHPRRGGYGVEGMDAGRADWLRAHWVALGRLWVQVGEG